MKSLEDGQKLDYKSQLSEWHPFLDDNRLIRLGGRLHRLQDNVNVKHPMILPDGHYFTELVTKKAHCQCTHG